MRRLIKILFLTTVIAALVNAYIESQKECGCYEDCWCKQPLLSNFRWVIPVGHRGPWNDPT